MKMLIRNFLPTAVFTAILVMSVNASAYKSGQLNCYFEIWAKSSWPNVVKTAPFSIDIAEKYESETKLDVLPNRILLRYVPGKYAANDVQVAVMTMKYEGFDTGAEVPLVNNGKYSFQFGHQASGLIGAFLNCVAENLN